jgi:ParB family chromosome partitioning protein
LNTPFGRFEDHRVTGGQRRAEFPAGHHQREVPRHDGANHADRLAGYQAQLIVRRGGDFVVDLVDSLAAPAQGICRAGYVDVQGVADRLAHVQGFQQRQLFGIGLEQRRETDHGGFAFGRRQARPNAGIEGGAGIFDGALCVGGVTAGNSGQQAAVDRAYAFEGVTGNSGGVFAVDVGAAFDLQILGALFPVGTGQGGHASVLLLLNTRARRCPPAASKNACPPANCSAQRQLPP